MIPGDAAVTSNIFKIILQQVNKNYSITDSSDSSDLLMLSLLDSPTSCPPSSPLPSLREELGRSEDDENDLLVPSLLVSPLPEERRVPEEKRNILPSSPPSSPGEKLGKSVAPSSNKKKNWKKKMKKKLKGRGSSQHPVWCDDYQPWKTENRKRKTDDYSSPPRTGCTRYGETGCRFICVC